MHILGCRFHWGQALQRWWAEAGFIPLGERSMAMKEFFRSCLGLCMVRERDLEEAIVELREVKMEDGTLEAAKHSFVDYLEKEWIYGAYPPSV